MRGWSDVLTAYRTLKLLSTGRGGGDLEGGKGSSGGRGEASRSDVDALRYLEESHLPGCISTFLPSFIYLEGFIYQETYSRDAASKWIPVLILIIA